MKLKICEKKSMNKESIILMKQTKKLIIKEGMFVRKTAKFKQMVLPQKFYYLVYSELHEKLAHLGSERVLELARRRFYWPRMKKSIENVIRKHCRCIISQKPNVPERAPMVPKTSTFPFELVSIDYLHLYRAHGGYEYALVCCDHFTKKSGLAAVEKSFNDLVPKFGFLNVSIMTRERNLTTTCSNVYANFQGHLHQKLHPTAQWEMVRPKE